MSRIRLPLLYQDHMMLQRDKILYINGYTEDATEISVALGETRVTVPVKSGSFYCAFPPQPAGEHQTLAFYLDGESEPELTLSDISIGDIWMACGQSNMEYFLRYDAHWNDTKNAMRNPKIHMFNFPRIAYDGQKNNQEECGYWFKEDDPAWPLFSAPGYSFARHLQPSLQVPIGIVGCNWGGTPACAWMDEDSLLQPPLDIFQKEYKEAISAFSPEELERRSMEAWEFENSYRHQLEWRTMMYGLTAREQKRWMKEHASDPVLPMGPYHHYRPSGLYHTMIQKIAPFSVKGILWYQGESDSDHAEIYDQTMAALIHCFRTVWKDENLPFLFVQLAPFGKWLDCAGDHYAVVRSKQEKVSHSVPGTGMVSIMDLGCYEDIHPKFKMEVGRRLALLARGRVYGQSLQCESPEFSHVSREGDKVILQFRYAEGGLSGQQGCMEAFHIMDDSTDLPPEAEPAQYSITDYLLSEGAITLTLDRAAAGPLTISFAEEDFCEVHIWNKAGLPVKPFHCIVR